jgi:hypothetical protein
MRAEPTKALHGGLFVIDAAHRMSYARAGDFWDSWVEGETYTAESGF